MAWQSGSTRRWRATRAFVLARDGYRCRAHAEGWCAAVPGEHRCRGEAPEDGGHAHHTLGRSVTGDDPEHIVAACEPCNLHIGDPAARSPVTDPQPQPRTPWRK